MNKETEILMLAPTPFQLYSPGQFIEPLSFFLTWREQAATNIYCKFTMCQVLCEEL